MLRTFDTHKIRKQVELTSKCWDFTPLESDKSGTTIKVMTPSCWENYSGFESYRGKCVYETTFEAEGDICLEFKGISHNAEVYVDDVEIGSHYNAYTPFKFIIKNLSNTEHILKIIVDNSFKEEYSLNRPNDYMSYGGINRGIILQELSKAYIEKIHVTPIKRNALNWTAKVEIWVNNISNESLDFEVKTKLKDTNISTGTNKLESGINKVFDEEVEFTNVESWTLENPKLYNIESQLVIDNEVSDDLIDRVGFRTVKVDGNRVLINDRPIRIKGFNRHEDHPYFGSAIPLSAMAYDLNLIKDMGGNAVRTSHYPNDELFLDLCDEMGILVWEENHARGMGERYMSNPLFQTHSMQVINEMIENHFNHPSIYIWGILNECASETVLGRKLYKEQLDYIKQLDTSRPHSFATCRYGKDISLDLPDVVSWNMYPYWYEQKTCTEMVNELYDYTMQSCNKQIVPFMVTEIGAGAIYGFRTLVKEKWTEDLQAEILEKQLSELLGFDKCYGVFIWQFCDIRVSAEYFDRRPRTRNNKGIVDEYRRPKLAYNTVKRIYESYSNYWD